MTAPTNSNLKTSRGGSKLISQDAPHYYEVLNENGERYCHCGGMRDVDSMISLHPNFTFVKVYLPNIKHPTVNVSAQRLEDDKSLPASELQELNI